MIDIHQHLLYGVDDGSPDLDTSLAMAREAAADGVTHIVCTPHASERYPYQAPLIEERYAELRELLARPDGIEPCLRLPHDRGEYPRGSGQPLALLDRRQRLPADRISPTLRFPRQMNDAMFLLQSTGYRLIITHPERYSGACWAARRCWPSGCARAAWSR